MTSMTRNMAFRNIEFEIPKHNKDDTKKKHTLVKHETLETITFKLCA
jgi:hypothetical protein